MPENNMKINRGKLLRIEKENTSIGMVLNLVFEKKDGKHYIASGTPKIIERDFSPNIYNWVGQEIIQKYKRKLSF